MKTINGRESSVLALLVQCKGLSLIDKQRILSTLDGQALKIAKVITGQIKRPNKNIKKIAQGFIDWAKGLKQ